MTKDDLVSKDTALKMAIEAMTLPNNLSFLMAITACKEALAQPAQEPVLLNVETHDGKTYKVEVSAPSWQGLSDDEIQEELKKMWDKGLIPSYSIVAFARAIEQALKEKNNV